MLNLGLSGDQHRTLLSCAIGQGRLLSGRVHVVCGARYPLVRFRCQDQPSRWVVAAGWGNGMAASLAAGIGSLGPRARGVFVLVADQPLLDPEALERFADEARRVPVQPAAANYGHGPGVPAYLPRWLWPQVLALHGDKGAGRLLAKANARRFDISGVHDDVDTPEDWRRIRQQLMRPGSVPD